MATSGPPASGLLGRRSECETLDRLVVGVRAGRGQVLVLRREAGIGKTALLEYLLDRASGCRIARVAGIESEIELAFAGSQQVCAPMLGRVECRPLPQREAVSTALGRTDAARRRAFPRYGRRPRASVQPGVEHLLPNMPHGARPAGLGL
jgi:hypothetical protein